jgi:VanZ family protein
MRLASRTLSMRGFFIKAARITGWFLAVVIAALSLVPPWLRPETGAPHDLEHFAIFFATGAAFGFGYSHKPLETSIALVIFAAAIEIAQLFVPGRHARLGDFVVDALALCVGVGLASFLATRTSKLNM